MTHFRWKNCFADVQTSKHDITIRAYFDDVIVPSIKTLEQRISELGQSDDPIDMFIQSDTLDVLQEAKMAFALSIQSIWERQLRTYLVGCAKELRPTEGLKKQVEKANWDALKKIFRELRGLRLESFPSFPLLDRLQHLGNACRHGDGKSANQLHQLCPELWKPIPPMPVDFGDASENPPSVSSIDISSEHLRQFVEAIAQFWDDTTYIYNESKGFYLGVWRRMAARSLVKGSAQP